MEYKGYYREPTINKDKIVFVCEDDLWIVESHGGIPRRLSANPGITDSPFLSPDGELLAYVGRDQGYPEIYVMPAAGGTGIRLTNLGTRLCRVLGWIPDGNSVIFASPASMPFYSWNFVYAVSKEGGLPEQLAAGPAASASFRPGGGGIVIGRHGKDPARWKRYRGGQLGRIWIQRESSGKFELLLDIESNLAHPMWINDRIYFIGDHEGIGNIYSCDLRGSDITRHTDHGDFYARNPKTDGSRIAYHAGGELYILDPRTDSVNKVEIDFRSPRIQRAGRYVDAARYLESYDFNAKGHSLVITTRGKPFKMAHWEGAARQLGVTGGKTRYRLSRWLNDGKRILTVSDGYGDGEEVLEIFDAENGISLKNFDQLDIGRAIYLEISPVHDAVILTNHRNELIHVDIETGNLKVLDRSDYLRIGGISWSPDGKWVAYGFWKTRNASIIKLYSMESGDAHELTEPMFMDAYPWFDPDGKYLYFQSSRFFDPVVDQLKFDYGFPRGRRPMLIILSKSLHSPFIPKPAAPGLDDVDSCDAVDSSGAGDSKIEKQGAEGKGSKKEIKVEIDTQGIKDRVVSFPLPDGRYEEIKGAHNKVFYLVYPVTGTLHESWFDDAPETEATLEYYDFKKRKKEVFASSVTSYELSPDKKTIAYRSGEKLRVLKVSEKPEEKKENEPPGRDSGWLDLSRLKVFIDPVSEWKQMMRETWRLLREHYYVKDMAGVDWEMVYRKYLPLIDRISTRFELSDILWELGGELGTSHAYEIGGDYKLLQPPKHVQGFLGADFRYNPETQGYIIVDIIKGDNWNPDETSPLSLPGMNMTPGDTLLSINGQTLDLHRTPQMLLVNLGGSEVDITVVSKSGNTRTVTAKTLTDEMPVRLRSWVKKNTAFVHEKTDGKIGYVYMPDMGSAGFSEFFRAFRNEVMYQGLIIDVRNNAGGHISSLILEKLMRKRLGYSIPRWGEIEPMPPETLAGPIVAITDENAGSDGDVFSHTFKQLKIGPLIGKRTWGGIVGLNPTHLLVDGSITTQPEFFNWFNDVEWELENRGAVPDIEVEYTPEDYISGRDPQLERAIEEVLQLLNKFPGTITPDIKKRPCRAIPKLAPRK